jgi:hypothetical protein
MPFTITCGDRLSERSTHSLLLTLQCSKLGVEIEGHHTETGRSGLVQLHQPELTFTSAGPGVYETALAYTNARQMADNAVLFKLAVKSCKFTIRPHSISVHSHLWFPSRTAVRHNALFHGQTPQRPTRL